MSFLLPRHMQVIWALVALAAAQAQEDCQSHASIDETSMLQVTSLLATDRDSSQESHQNYLDLNAAPSAKKNKKKHKKHKKAYKKEAARQLTTISSPPSGWGREVELIDFVYCWAGESQQKDAATGNISTSDTTNHNEGYGFNEMELSVRSLLMFAPWLNKVYVLVNGPEEPAWAAEHSRVQMVDRCTLFPKQSDCPTKNTAACQAVVHRIPALQEHFVFMEDDFFFVHPVMPVDFFARDGRPLITSQVKNWDLAEMYGPHEFLHYLGPDIPPEHVPPRINNFVHRPVPMLTSFTWAMEDEYTKWFAFVRSHKTRFVCCNTSYYGNGLEEDFLLVYPALLKKHRKGVAIPYTPTHDSNCHCDTQKGIDCINSHIATGRKTVVVQSCQKAAQWERAKNILLENMERFADDFEARNFTKEHFVRDHGEYTNPILAAVLASVSAANLVLAVCACWVIYQARRSTRTRPAGLFGVTTFAQGAVLFGFVVLSLLCGYLRKNSGGAGYSPIAAAVLLYIGKIVVSFFMYLCKADLRVGLVTLLAPGSTRFGKLPAFMITMIPGGLLAVYDAFTFSSLVHVDPATYQVALFIRVIFVSFVWQVMFQRKLSGAQWLAVFLFMLAGITTALGQAQLDDVVMMFLDPVRCTSVMTVVAMTLTGAFACVLSEVLLKDLPVHTDLVNTCTYLWGLVWLMFAMTYQQGHRAVYDNFASPTAWAKLQADPWMIASIFCLTAFGIVAAYILKELSNIVKELSGCLVIIASTVLQWMFVGSRAMTSLSTVGIFMALLGVHVYNTDPLPNRFIEHRVRKDSDVKLARTRG